MRTFTRSPFLYLWLQTEIDRTYMVFLSWNLVLYLLCNVEHVESAWKANSCFSETPFDFGYYFANRLLNFSFGTQGSIIEKDKWTDTMLHVSSSEASFKDWPDKPSLSSSKPCRPPAEDKVKVKRVAAPTDGGYGEFITNKKLTEISKYLLSHYKSNMPNYF